MSNEKKSLAENIVILADIVSTLQHKTSFKVKAAFYRQRRRLKRFISSKVDDSFRSSSSDKDYPT